MKKVFVKTYGCQMNVYDSARIVDVLAPFGYAAAETADDADLVVLNTCHIREKAAEKGGAEKDHERSDADEAQDADPRVRASLWSRPACGKLAEGEGQCEARGCALGMRAHRDPIPEMLLPPGHDSHLPHELTQRGLNGLGCGCEGTSLRCGCTVGRAGGGARREREGPPEVGGFSRQGAGVACGC